MKIQKSAQAGSFESSDILILVEPAEEKSGRNIELDSNVKYQYGDKILEMINECLDSYQIEDIHLIAKDKGALEPTIKARLETVMQRALNIQNKRLPRFISN